VSVMMKLCYIVWRE